MPILTIFTPTYNRIHTLERTYKSLKMQTNKNFEWLIVDDGSTDNTRQVVEDWIKNTEDFVIRYAYKKNGGMHTAHNLAYELIDTELNVCIDSDDAMPLDAVESIITFWKEKGSKNVAGIIALDSDFNGNIIGTSLPNIEEADTLSVYDIYGARGDKKFIYRTDVIKSVSPYPEFDGEKLVPLGYKYSLVAKKYKMLLMNKIVCQVEYQQNGSSNTIYKQYLQSPRGFAASKALNMVTDLKFIDRMRAVVHYIAECRIAKDDNWLKNSPRKVVCLMLYPLGFLAEIYIRYVNSRSR